MSRFGRQAIILAVRVRVGAVGSVWLSGCSRRRCWRRWRLGRWGRWRVGWSAGSSIIGSSMSFMTRSGRTCRPRRGSFSPDRTVLPIPDRNFGGTIGRTLDQSVADWTIVPGGAGGAPNVLICLIDDAGFGQPDTFGEPISTPNLTRVQQAGLTYNAFHVTALCSPTRAALLTGRNTTGWASARSPSIRDRSPAIRLPGRVAARRCRGFCRRTAMSPAGLASGI